MSRAVLAVAASAAIVWHPALLGAQAPRGPGGAEVVTDSVFVRDVGPGEGGRLLRRALLEPHLLLRGTDRVVLPRDTTIETTVILIGGADLAVGAEVRGDVIVVDGDLFMHPGGHVRGRAIAVGGGVYRSTLARIEGRVYAFRDLTYEAIDTERGIALDYRVIVAAERVPVVTLPGIRGLRIPSYDRVNGLSLALGPRINLDSGRLFLDPLAVYRSDLGEVDAALAGGASIGRRDSVSLFVGRGTFSSDQWIRSDFWNSVLSLVIGRDARNYFRADRAEGRLHRRWEGAYGAVEAFVGGRGEDAWSVGPHASVAGPETGITSGPWSIVGREDDVDGMLRPNPFIDPGRTLSALAGATVEWESADGFVVEGWALVEQALDVPEGFDRFTQSTLDVEVAFPTFRTQSFELAGHALLTGPGVAPRQRWSYLGGSGTLPTFDLLEFGGDELLFLESRYHVPLEGARLPLFGVPVVTLRHMLGAAGPGRLPDFEQNLGVRLSVFLVRVDYTIDPASSARDFSVGVSLTR